MYKKPFVPNHDPKYCPVKVADYHTSENFHQCNFRARHHMRHTKSGHVVVVCLIHCRKLTEIARNPAVYGYRHFVPYRERVVSISKDVRLDLTTRMTALKTELMEEGLYATSHQMDHALVCVGFELANDLSAWRKYRKERFEDELYLK